MSKLLHCKSQKNFDYFHYEKKMIVSEEIGVFIHIKNAWCINVLKPQYIISVCL